jgi:hypothetical protein
MIALPTIFEMNFMKVQQSLETHINQSGVLGAVLMSLNAIAGHSWFTGHHLDHILCLL